MADVHELFRIRPFRLVICARSLSALGNAIAPIALAFAVLDAPSGSPSLLGWVLAARSLAQVVFLLAGGLIADRWSRRVVLVGADTLAGMSQTLMAVLFVSRAANPAALLLMSAVNGAAAAVFLPATTGILPEVVPADRMRAANGLMRLGLNMATMSGAAISGLVIALIGPGLALAVDGATFFISALLVSRIATGADRPNRDESLLSGLLSGWREFASRRWLWVVVLMLAIVNACFQSCVLVLGPIIAKEALGGPSAWALVMSAESAGLIAGSLVVLRLQSRYPLRTITLTALGFTPPFLLLATDGPLWALIAVMVLSGICADIFMALWDTTLQTHVPSHALSRVSSYDSLGSFALAPIALAAIVPLTTMIGMSRTLVLGAVLTAACALAALLTPDVYRLPARPPAEPSIRKRTA